MNNKFLIRPEYPYKFPRPDEELWKLQLLYSMPMIPAFRGIIMGLAGDEGVTRRPTQRVFDCVVAAYAGVMWGLILWLMMQ